MQAIAKRPLLDGRRYDPLFPKVSGTNELVKANATLSDSLDLIKRVVRDFHTQTTKIARILKGANVRDTCQNIWEFLYRHVQYTLDEKGKEQIRSPARVWADRIRGVDCDCYSVFISSVLSCLNIRHTLRVTKYPDFEGIDPDPPFSHIYVVVASGNQFFIIDPVTDRFNFEVPYLAKKDLQMDLEILNGIPPGSYSPSSMDFEDMMAAGGGMGEIAPALQNSAKYSRIAQEAAAKGMTIEQYTQWTNQEFQRQNGISVEQNAAQVKQTIQTAQQQGAAQAAADIERFKAELQKRRIPFPANATRDQLIELLRTGTGSSTPGKIANVVNKFNPATAAVRLGILVAMKINYLGIARKVRYGYLTESQAKQMGLSSDSWNKAKEVRTRLEKIHYTAGGDISHLQKAILEGSGNKDRRIPVTGLSGVGFAGVGLGEPITATVALTAATTVLAAVAAAVKTIQDGKNATQEEATVNQAEAESAMRQMQSSEAAAIDSMPVTVSPTYDIGPTYEPPPTTDYNPNPENREVQNPGDDSGGEKKKTGAVQWVKDNPVLTGAIALGLGTGVYIAVKAMKPKKPAAKPKSGTALNGTPRKKRPPAKKKTPTSTRKPKGVRVVKVP